MSEASQVSGSDVLEFGGMPRLALQKVKEFSPSLQIVGPLQNSDVQLWVEYWKSSGFLS